jgi:rubrerythrin
MNVFDFAINMEKEGEQYYRELAKKTSDEGLQRIFNMLADDEVKHRQTFEKMKNKKKPDVIETQILEDAKNVFSQMKVEGIDLAPDIEQLDLYKKAQEIELKSENFYRHEASLSENSEQKECLLKIAEEEKKHYHLLQNIIEFISRPQQWIENAEFYHLDEY